MKKKIWYVYQHRRLDTNEIFYIGIGKKKNFQRAYATNQRNRIWRRITKKVNWKVEILFTSLTKIMAYKKEIMLIEKYGRMDLKTGRLCNLTAGGGGILEFKRSDEFKRKMSLLRQGCKNPMFGVRQTKEMIEKRIKYLRGKSRPEEVKNKISKSNRGKKRTEEAIAKMKLAVKKTPIKIIDSSGIERIFPEIKIASETLINEGIPAHRSRIYEALKNKKQYKGFYFEKFDLTKSPLNSPIC